jgi:hypothetical protein
VVQSAAGDTPRAAPVAMAECWGDPTDQYAIDDLLSENGCGTGVPAGTAAHETALVTVGR